MPPRSAVDRLPEAVRRELDKKLADAGYGNLVQLSAWLAELGYHISKSSLGVHSKSMKERTEGIVKKARERVEYAYSLREEGSDKKAALMELTELVAMDQLLDLFETGVDMDIKDQMINLPKLIRAGADLNRSAVGSAKWKREFEAEVRRVAAEAATKSAKDAGVSEETIQRIRRDVLGMAE